MMTSMRRIRLNERNRPPRLNDRTRKSKYYVHYIRDPERQGICAAGAVQTYQGNLYLFIALHSYITEYPIKTACDVYYRCGVKRDYTSDVQRPYKTFGKNTKCSALSTLAFNIRSIQNERNSVLNFFVFLF